MWIAAWWVSGMAGATLIWLDWKRKFPNECHRCPTRKGVLAIFFSGALGLMMLGAGILITISSWLERQPFDSKWSKWWDKPVC